MSMGSEFNTAFVPKENVSRTFGKQTVMVYPEIQTNMSHAEKSYAFMVTKSALEATTIPVDQKLQIFAGITRTGPLVGVLQSKFIAIANSEISRVGNFSVLSYHGRNGVTLPATVDNGDLRNTNGMTNATRRQPGIMYAKLACDLRFTEVDEDNITAHPFTYFIRLPNEELTVTNSTGQELQLNTFHGLNDWATSIVTQPEMDQILKSDQAFGNPFTLLPSAITDLLSSAVINSTESDLRRIALSAAWPSICRAIFKQICPNLDRDPIAVIQNIHQVSKDDQGKEVQQTVEQYFNSLQCMTNFLPIDEDWSIDITQHFWTHLLSNVRVQMNANGYTHNSAASQRDPFNQLMSLQRAFAAATVAEDTLARFQRIAKETVQSSLTLVTNVDSTWVGNSVAENTMSTYDKDKKMRGACWGCGSSEHSFANKKAITCPNKDKPGVMERAGKARKEFNDRLTAKKKAARAKREGSDSTGLLSKLSDTQIKALSADELRTLIHEDKPSPSKKSRGESNIHTFVVVFEANSAPSLPRLPISVESNLPHISLPIGHDLQTNFSLSVAYDTCAACNVGYAGHHLPIAERYPELVKSLTYTENKFTPLTLSGIVNGDNDQKAKPSAILPVVIEYWMPFLTKEGHKTTLKIALGNDVSVNTIIGMPMIRPAKLSFDLVDNVVESGVLDTEPFPVIYRPTIQSAPDFSKTSSDDPKLFVSTEDFDHVSSKDVKVCILAMANGIATADFAKSITQETKLNNKVEVAEDSNIAHDKSPISVPKAKWRPKTASIWEEEENDDTEHPDFDSSFQKNTGNSLRKSKASALDLSPPNPAFHYIYSPDKDEVELEANLMLDQDLSIDMKNRVKSFVKEFWDVFREEGVKIPIRGYEMVIDTGKHKPIACRQPHYGIHETPIMQQTIIKLLGLGFIKADSKSPWGARITLAPKPHQEDITEIENYIWRFCINYIRLNMVTRPAEYPIPRCDDAVMYGFGEATFFILLDASAGYHQVQLSESSMMKTAFFAPHGRKYCWVVMPFGLKNAPPVYVAMMHDLKDLWTTEAERQGVDTSTDNGTTIIIDDTFIYGVSVDHAFLMTRCVCLIARKYHLTWKLKKSRWLPSKIEFVGVDIHKEGGNSPAQSKDIILTNWKVPTTPRHVMGFIGFAIFYLRWCPWFEMKIKPMRESISDHTIDHVFTASEFGTAAISAFHEIRDYILSKPILQRANIKKRFYLKTDFSALGLGFALCQPDDSAESIAAMNREDAGGECEFEFCVSKMRLLPVAFGSRKTKGNEVHFHSHPGESLAASWGTTKNRHFLWGRIFTLVTDCRALMWLMDYKGHNHAVRRLQLEMLGYAFTIVNRTGAMLEDANYFSRLGEDIHVDPLLKDYLSIARQAYIDNPPSTEPLGDQNMPGRRSKRTKMIQESLEPTAGLDLAQVIWENESIDVTPPSNKLSRKYANIPIQICETGKLQEPSKKHFSYITETAVRLSTFKWCLSQPGHGHFIEASQSASIRFEPIMICDTDQNCRNTMQSRFASPFIFESISKMASFCDTHDMPFVQGYYINLDSPKDDYSRTQELKIHEQIIASLKTRANLEIIVIQISCNLNTKTYASMKQRLISKGWLLHEKTIQSALDFSDRVSTDFDIIIGLSANYFQSGTPTAFNHLSPTPAVPNGMSPKILVEFNQPQFALPYVGELFTVEPGSDIPSRKPTVQYIIRQTEADLQPAMDAGFQVYHKDSPAPLPSPITSGLFANLFGISFDNNKYTAENNETKEHVRAIAVAEFTSFFGYGPNFSTYLNGQPDVTNVLRRTLPYNTATRIAETTSQILESSINIRSNEASSVLGVDLSISALFNGIIGDQMPDESAWCNAYSHDVSCAAIIKMIKDPSKITPEELIKIHSVYRSPIRQSQMKWEDQRLVLYETVANSTKTVRLTVIPLELRKHIFAAFHANPLGGHLSLYYTLHRIRLRYHWPHMYSYIKQNIDDCVACVLRNGGTRASSEFLYSFPISAPFMTVHADAWVPGKTTSFDGYTGLMIVVCHMTGFAAIEPMKDMNSSAFARAVYSILLRYGLSQVVITDPDSKFKGNFKEAFATLKIQHHLSARGNHNAILVERFNRYLNAGLRVFNNDRATNRVFLEGTQTLTYAWNSCPVLGTDLSRSLLTVGREFHFPIDFEANRRASFDISDEEKKLFAENLTDLLLKSREIYMLLITEHRAAHREYRNAQLNHPRKFKLGDIVFTNVQVQSKLKTGTVTKLAYIKRGPYKIIKDYPGGSYELEPLSGRSRTTIKKHGSDLYISPKSLIPHRPIQASDQAFGDLQKKTISNPYQLVGVEGYEPSRPWAAPAATSQIQLATLRNIPDFPTMQELDDEYDGWPESGNPFVNKESSTPAMPTAAINDGICSLQTSVRTRSSIIADLVRSEDRLFFISFAQEKNQQRREWKLVRIDFQRSLQQYPNCLQDGRFLMEFFIEHHRDQNLDICTRRYWLEYHKTNSHKSISVDYHILQPSQYSENTARSMGLIPYREWIQVDDPSITLHGPFNFATLNNRKTRDRVAEQDWLVLQDRKALYSNQAPKLSQRIMQVDISQPTYENIKGDPEVQSRCATFMFNLEFKDMTLQDFGATTP